MTDNPPNDAPSMSKALWHEVAEQDIAAVENYLREEILSTIPTIVEISTHVLNAGGKRLRPALVCLSGRCVNSSVDMNMLVKVASSLELLHMASLLHDDVVDGTNMRRGRRTANSVYGNGVTVLSGDYLLSRAVRLLAKSGDIELIRAIADVSSSLAEGEVQQSLLAGDTGVTEDKYLEVISKKTATLIDVCCRCGAITAGANEEQQAALKSYGQNLGMAFQMVDDLLDYVGDPARIGKPCGSDVADGKFTLPFIWAMKQAGDSERKMLVELAKQKFSKKILQQISQLIETLGGFEVTRSRAMVYSQRAVDSLGCLPNSKEKDALIDLCDFVVRRDV